MMFRVDRDTKDAPNQHRKGELHRRQRFLHTWRWRVANTRLVGGSLWALVLPIHGSCGRLSLASGPSSCSDGRQLLLAQRLVRPAERPLFQGALLVGLRALLKPLRLGGRECMAHSRRIVGIYARSERR